LGHVAGEDAEHVFPKGTMFGFGRARETGFRHTLSYGIPLWGKLCEFQLLPCPLKILGDNMSDTNDDLPKLSDEELDELDNLVEDFEISELVKRRIGLGVAEGSASLKEIAEKLGVNTDDWED
jgi:hypothetical protein